MSKAVLKSLAKKIIPLSLRMKLKQIGYHYQDIVNPIKGARVPSRAATFIGGGDFVAVGDDFFETLKRHGLKPDHIIMDVGCGQGRMARPLVDYLTGGSYTGLDIAKSGIEWCKSEYADVPSFRFLHMDLYNSRYNAMGKTQAKEYVFPVEDNSQDMIFLTSVFTHMLAADIENYLNEFNRVLKPGGTALITWYILDDLSRGAKEAALDFCHEFDDVSRTTVKSTPEAAIAFDIDFVKSAYENAGLTIASIEQGHWARPESPYMLQDMIIARKVN